MIKIRIEVIIGLFITLAVALFLFLTIYLGIFRFDSADYNTFNIVFGDVTGLNKKDEVKIAGVHVGWVEDIVLEPSDWRVNVAIKVGRKYELRENAQALIRQDGILGGRFLDIYPGEHDRAVLATGEQLQAIGSHAPSFEDVLKEIHSIAKDVSNIAQTVTELLGSEQGIDALEKIFKGLNQVVMNLADLIDVTGDVAQENKRALGKLIIDLGAFIDSLNEHNIPTTLKRTLETFKETSKQINQAAESINKGEGVLGTLMCDESCKNIQQTITCVQDTVSFVQNMHVGVDVHGEFMLGKNERFDERDIKGYFNAFLCPFEDYFVLGGLVTTNLGRVRRKDIFITKLCEGIDDKDECLKRREDVRKFDDFLWNFQVGRMFKHIGFRAGMFESAVGAAIDVRIPFFNDRLTWLSSFEAFDFRGRQRIDDDRPHLRWLNRLFFNEYIYLAVGVEDFVSRTNSSAFVGGGISVSI